MSYCTTAELVNVTGSTRSPTILQAVIDEADRQINLYLKSYGITGSVCDELKSVSLTLSKAGLLEFGLHNGDYQMSRGDYTSSINVTETVKSLKSVAFADLDRYITATTTDNGRVPRCSRVRTRCI